MYEVILKIHGMRGVVKSVKLSRAAAIRACEKANSTPGCSATWSRLF